MFDQWKTRTNQIGRLLPATLILLTIVTDQYTKYLARTQLETHEKLSFSDGFFQFSLIVNHGGFLGIVSELPEIVQFIFLNVCVSILLLVGLVYLFGLKRKTNLHAIPLVFIIGGGISNLIDRFVHDGGVTDFLSIGVYNLRTGVFNFADIYILIGSYILGYSLLTSPQKTE